MSEPETKSKRPYFRPTTAAQRRLLFETYEATQDVAAACAKAHVGQGTFYYWRARFEAGGYAALEQERSRAPHRTRLAPTSAEIKAEVISYRQEHPEAGYRTVAQRVRQQHNWAPVIGPSTVRRILLKAGLGPAKPVKAKAGPTPTVVHAPAAEQTVNIDLCVVPLNHEAKRELISASLGAVASGDFSPTEPGDAD